eukprot:3846133-Rhodomonas_salina.4
MCFLSSQFYYWNAFNAVLVYPSPPTRTAYPPIFLRDFWYWPIACSAISRTNAHHGYAMCDNDIAYGPSSLRTRYAMSSNELVHGALSLRNVRYWASF